MQTFTRLLRNLILFSLFLIAHVFLFSYYSEIQENSATCVAKAEKLQLKLNNALIPEDSVSSYVSDNLYPGVKRSINNIFNSNEKR